MRLPRLFKRKQNPDEYEWTPKELEEFSRECDAYVISEVVAIMERYGCKHGHDLSGTPPMMYPEALVCVLKSWRDPNCLEN